MKGEQLWEHKDVSMLKDPRDVTVENKFNVYVTSYTYMIKESRSMEVSNHQTVVIFVKM
jgi:hypothetical protein